MNQNDPYGKQVLAQIASVGFIRGSPVEALQDEPKPKKSMNQFFKEVNVDEAQYCTQHCPHEGKFCNGHTCKELRKYMRERHKRWTTKRH